MLVLMDNYDSIICNLVQYFGELGADLRVFRNNQITLDELIALKPDQLVISPGPGEPLKWFMNRSLMNSRSLRRLSKARSWRSNTASIQPVVCNFIRNPFSHNTANNCSRTFSKSKSYRSRKENQPC